MSFAPQVSLVVVSRNRPEGLKRLIASLRFQSYRNFEVIVVSNHTDTEFLSALPLAENIRHVFFDHANISAARNHGIEQSAGEIVAFCDDDAVPEPFWLTYLIASFENPKVGSAGGFVRGRNGIDFQWKAIKCDQFGDDFSLVMKSQETPETFEFDGMYFIKVQGTNCAFRRVALDEIDGFDESYRFFLDETDVSFELAKRGWLTTITPLAEVQHGFEESAERTRQRVPKTLANISASKAYFIAKHAGQDGTDSLDEFCRTQRNRLIRLMVEGNLEPFDVERLMGSLAKGLSARTKLRKTNQRNALQKKLKFRPFFKGNPKALPQFVAIAGSSLTFQKLSRLAVMLESRNTIVTVFRFSYTALFHKRFFDPRGYWVQTGGLFGRSNRLAKILTLQSLRKRAHVEMDGLATQRPFVKLHVVRIFSKMGLFSPD